MAKQMAQVKPTAKVAKSSLIERLGRLAADSGKLEELGRSIVVDAIKQVAAERTGIKTRNPDIFREVQKGEIVPRELTTAPNIKFDDEYRAIDYWCLSWWKCIPIWQRFFPPIEYGLWCDLAGPLIDDWRWNVDDIKTKVGLEMNLEAEEFMIINKLRQYM